MSFLFLAGHTALDFMNTVARVDGELVDALQTNEDVVEWLRQAGMLTRHRARAKGAPPPRTLLQTARTLRENIRGLVEQRKQGKRGDLSILNAFLAEAGSYPRLHWGKSGALSLERVGSHATAEQLLAPVAEAAADLLITADFTRVRRCDDKQCVLWFADHTRAGKRRWCSMAICGNRAKQAAHRNRLKAAHSH
jgi:predicted RNA-binding Zn ribbon-like protein